MAPQPALKKGGKAKNVAIDVSDTKEASKAKCEFCQQSDLKGDNELEKAGRMFKFMGKYYHYFCVLFSVGIKQDGSDETGLRGFNLAEIQRVLKGSQGKTAAPCQFCSKKGATAMCAKCPKKRFHYTCGRQNDAAFIYHGGTMGSYCKTHRPKSKVKAKVLEKLCMAGCMENIEDDDVKVMVTPCCFRRYHLACVQLQALQAGSHHFKCCMCSDKDKFAKAAADLGIYIPVQDASWEQEEGFYGFQAQGELYAQCDSKKCLCPKGRKHSLNGTYFELIRCEACGSSAVHIKCGQLLKKAPFYICSDHDNAQEQMDQHKRDIRNNPDYSSEDESEEAIDVVNDTSPKSKSPGRKRKITLPQSQTQPTPTVSTVRQLCRQTAVSESTQQPPVVPPSKAPLKPKAVKKSRKVANKKCKKKCKKKKCTCSVEDTESVQGSSAPASKSSADKKPKGRPKKKKTLPQQQATVTEEPPQAGSEPSQPSPPKIPKKSPAKSEVKTSLLKKGKKKKKCQCKIWKKRCVCPPPLKPAEDTADIDIVCLSSDDEEEESLMAAEVDQFMRSDSEKMKQPEESSQKKGMKVTTQRAESPITMTAEALCADLKSALAAKEKERQTNRRGPDGRRARLFALLHPKDPRLKIPLRPPTTITSSQQETSSQPSPAKQVPPPAKRSAAASSKSSMSQSDASATQVQDEQVQQQQHGTCRRVHGQEKKDLWCSQCKNKQACSRWMREIQSLEDEKIDKDASSSPPAQSATNKGVSQQPKATLPILGGSSSVPQRPVKAVRPTPRAVVVPPPSRPAAPAMPLVSSNPLTPTPFTHRPAVIAVTPAAAVAAATASAPSPNSAFVNPSPSVVPSVIRNWDVPASSLVQNSVQGQPALAITQPSFGEMVPYGTQPCVQQAGDLPTLGPTFSMANHIPTIVQVNPGSLTQEATPGAIVIGYDNEGIPIYHQPALGQLTNTGDGGVDKTSSIMAGSSAGATGEDEGEVFVMDGIVDEGPSESGGGGGGEIIVLD